MLSQRQRELWNFIKNQSGVVMAYGVPGISKSATFRAIAKNLNLKYVDLRVSTKDETDFGTYPSISEIDGMKVVSQTVPDWAVEANLQPTLIHFEELNRSSDNLKNAVLGIMLEKIIGTKFKFNDNVYVVASGNPPSDKDMSVEELGTALRNRLIPIDFKLSFRDWCDDFANKNVIPEVISFLREKPDYFGNNQVQQEKFIDDDSTKQYPSPRSWTFLSDYIKGFEDEYSRKQHLTSINKIKSFVGEIPATAFVHYVQEIYKVNINDVLSGKADINKLNNMNVQRLTNDFHEYKSILDLDKKEMNNWKIFVANMNDEIRASHISTVVENLPELEDKKHKKIMSDFLKPYKNLVDIIVKSLPSSGD